MLQECSIFRVARVFFDEPTLAHYLKEVSAKSGLAHTSCKQHLDRLVSMGVVERKIDKKGDRSYPVYTAALGAPSYVIQKRIANIGRLLESGVLDHLRDALMPRTIILFGSFVRGEDVEESDIDLYVEGSRKAVDLQRFEKALHRKIQLHTRDHLDECSKELKNNILNGMVIYGFVEAFE